MKNKFLLQEYLIQAKDRYPNNVAVEYGSEKVTYSELFARSMKIAAALKKMGIEKNMPVLLYCRKSDLAVEAIYGILLNHNAYVPVDKTSTPAYRCMVIIRESQTKYFIAEGEDLDRLVKDTAFDSTVFKEMHVLVLDDKYKGDKGLFAEYQEMGWDADIEMVPDLAQEEDSTAYILYTSGSTGIPKGAELSHKNARYFVDWCIDYFEPEQGERFLGITPFHFDLSIFDLYVSVASGGCLVLLSEQLEQNILKKIDFILTERINYIYSVPSLWLMILRYGKWKKDSFPALKKVLYAGEVFQPNDLAHVMDLIPNVKFYNLYGLIETNVITCYEVKREELQKQNSVPIGFACSDANLLVVQNGKVESGTGITGELYVSGPTVMKSYYQREDLTDKVMTTLEGKRYFKTGDIVRREKNGELVFLCRKDFMVKRNGFRIELPEIETVLCQMEEVQEAAVVAVEKNEKLFICAAVLVKESGMIKVLSIKQYLKNILPSYMMPDYFALMDSFKRSSSGKVDRSYLKQYFTTAVDLE